MSTTILRLPALKSRTGLSRSQLYLLIAQDLFPKQIRLGERAVGWLEDDVERWLQDQVRQSRSAIANQREAKNRSQCRK